MCIFQVSSAKVNMLHGKSNGSLTSQPRMVRIFPLLALNRNNAVPLFIEIYLLAFVIRSLFRLGLDEFEHVAPSNTSGYTHTHTVERITSIFHVFVSIAAKQQGNHEAGR